jgi:hypothetical protein
MQTISFFFLLGMISTSHSFSVTIQSAIRTHAGSTSSSTALSSTTTNDAQRRGMSDNLRSILKKPSKTLAVILDFVPAKDDMTPGDFSTLSMQLRKIKASALMTSDVQVAAAFCEEQATAQGDFPGPCPVFFVGEDDNVAALEAGVSAFIVDASSSAVVPEDDNVDIIYKVSSPEEVDTSSEASIAYLVDGNADNVQDILDAIPAGSVVVVSLKSMQPDNAELERAKAFKGVTAILLEQACVGDQEDIEYATFAVDGLTKKRSSTFNMSGLTGSTNGHFGGVATSTSTTWLRMKER